MQKSDFRLPPSANFHITRACNFGCRGCFATFNDVPGRLEERQQLEILSQLAECGVQKITFAGGEPTVVPWLPELVRHARALGMTTMVVSNGSLLDDDRLAELADHLDWLVLSVDSARSETNREIGRAQKGQQAPDLTSYRDVAERARACGIRLKVNTVVSSLNIGEDFVELLRVLEPERWKVMQIRAVVGQNDKLVEPLLIDVGEFDEFVHRHSARVCELGIHVVPESDDAMRGSYVMVDPRGRFFDSSGGTHTYSSPILDVGVEAAFRQVVFDFEKYASRGGVYQWTDAELPRLVTLSGLSGAGKDTAADYLIREHGYVRCAVATPIKRLAREIFSLSEQQVNGAERNVLVPRFGISPRALLQELGRFGRNIDPNIWVDLWRREISDLLESGVRVICTDVRTRGELELARSMGATTVWIERSGAGAPGKLAADCTETELLHASFDARIENEGSIAALHEGVLRVLRGRR